MAYFDCWVDGVYVCCFTFVTEVLKMEKSPEVSSAALLAVVAAERRLAFSNTSTRAASLLGLAGQWDLEYADGYVTKLRDSY